MLFLEETLFASRAFVAILICAIRSAFCFQNFCEFLHVPSSGSARTIGHRDLLLRPNNAVLMMVLGLATRPAPRYNRPKLMLRGCGGVNPTMAVLLLAALMIAATLTPADASSRDLRSTAGMSDLSVICNQLPRT